MDINRDKRAEAYDRIIEYQKNLHEKNQERIRLGIKAVLIIPLIFLIIMFKLESSKVVFLVLWIVSMFAISAYLITVEYADYKIQKQLKEWGLSDEDEIQGLINRDTVVEKVIRNSLMIEELKGRMALEDKEQEREQTKAATEEDTDIEIIPVPEEQITVEQEPVSEREIVKNVVKSPDDYAMMRRRKALETHNQNQKMVEKTED